MKLKALLFDMDGTIVPLGLVVKCFQECCRHFHLRVLTRKELMENAVGYKMSESIPKLIPGFDWRVFQKYFEKLQIRNFKKYSKLLPTVKKTFMFIDGKELKIGVVTTKIRSEASAILKGYGLPYDVLVGGDEVKRRKPNPESIIMACRKLRLAPKECMFVGDHPFDMEAAASAGCVPAGTLTGWGNKKNLKAAGAKYVIRNLEGLERMIEKGE
jgi:N-acetyl-D-muramate 6-phosphate phosphatase